MSSTSQVLKPVTFGDLKLSNRVVMAPMTRNRSTRDGVLPAYAADYYAQRASAGLIVTEATNISPQAVGYAFTPGIWSEPQVESWSRVTEAVHKAGGVIFLQLWHTGRVSHPSLQPNGEMPVSASAVKLDEMAFTYEGLQAHPTPRALRADEIPGIVEDYRKAAENARRAGFDGVEIHSANNYLLEQFVRDSTNQRDDAYGGSIANRLRFPLAVVRAVVDVWGQQRVGIRLSPTTTWPGNTPVDSTVGETFAAYVDELDRIGLLYVHFIEGVTQGPRETGTALDYPALRKRFKGIYISNNGLTLDSADARLAAGEADLFAFARPFIANPDLVDRWTHGHPLADAPRDYWFGGDSLGYSDWPRVHQESALDSA